MTFGKGSSNINFYPTTFLTCLNSRAKTGQKQQKQVDLVGVC